MSRGGTGSSWLESNWMIIDPCEYSDNPYYQGLVVHGNVIVEQCLGVLHPYIATLDTNKRTYYSFSNDMHPTVDAALRDLHDTIYLMLWEHCNGD